MKIRLCEHNKGSGKLFKLLKKEFPEANVKLKDCIKQCGLCKESLFVLVEDKPVSANDTEELMKEISLLLQGVRAHPVGHRM